MFDVVIGIVTIIIGIFILVSGLPPVVKVVACIACFIVGEFISRKNGGDYNG